MCAFGKLYFAYFNSSTTATVSFGHLILNLDVEFKGVVNNAVPIGLVDNSVLRHVEPAGAPGETKSILGKQSPPEAKSSDDPSLKVGPIGSLGYHNAAAKTLIVLGPSATDGQPPVAATYGKGWF